MPGRSLGMDARILIISPMRNEAAHVARVARALAAQTHQPAEWIVVNDASTDDTAAILQELQASIPFLSVHTREPDTEPVVDRLAVAAAPRAFNYGLARAGVRDWTHVMKLDGDIELPPNYFERMLEEYGRDPKLGMAAGNLIEPGRGGKMIPMPIARHHIHGALKLYTRECFEAIGGVPTRLGWDTIDETYARLRGFTTRNWDDVIGIHHRPHASADGTLRGRARHGECAYIAHFSPLWVALRSVKIMRDRPLIISGFAFFYGYVRSAVRRVEQVPDPEFRTFARSELRTRLRTEVFGVLRGRTT
jgi:poly-beta-1,6-N-acetyl-D-glucosamine synthase